MKRYILLIGLVSLLLMTFLAVWIMQSPNPINHANFDRIEDGMTEQQVYEILGSSENDNDNVEHAWIRNKTWSTPSRDTIVVSFKRHDDRWVVEGKRFYFPSFWQRIEHWWDNGTPMSTTRSEPPA